MEWDLLDGPDDADDETDDVDLNASANQPRASTGHTPTGGEIARGILGHVHGVVHDPDLSRSGTELGEGIMNDIQSSVYGDSEPRFGGSSDDQTPAGAAEVKFGAGACYRCGGTGRTTWTSSGSQEACWYCSGSGVAS